MKKLWTRDQLKEFFSKGKFPTELHFSNLIDSVFNKLDDGISKTEEDGLKLSPAADKEGVVSFFDNPIDVVPSWQISLKKDRNGSSLSFDHFTTDDEGNPAKKSLLYLGGNGRVGIGTQTPRAAFELNTTLGIGTRVGAFLIGSVPGDGKWHDVFPTPLDGMHAFEVVARIDGTAGKGKYALTHAIAMSAFGKGRNSIRQTRAYHGWYWNRIEFRWSGATHLYNLQVRTRNHYGLTPDRSAHMIQFHVSKLWDDSLFQYE